MKISIIIGTVREGRRSPGVAYLLRDMLELKGEKIEILDLEEYSFPIMKERLKNLKHPPAGMREFSQHLFDSDGIIIITPEYNGSYSGVLKNTLDYFKPEYYKKPIGVVTVSSGVLGGINASHHLLSWVLHVKAIPSPFKLLVKSVDKTFDKENRLIDEDFKVSADKFLKEFLWLSSAISQNS